LEVMEVPMPSWNCSEARNARVALGSRPPPTLDKVGYRLAGSTLAGSKDPTFASMLIEFEGW
jgi:hypothetical protein